MNIKLKLIILTALLSVTGYISAEPAPVIFDDIDTDASGCISREEAQVRKDLIDNFSKIDTDKNGTLCVDEYTVYENRDEFVPDEVEIPEVGAAPVM